MTQTQLDCRHKEPKILNMTCVQQAQGQISCFGHVLKSKHYICASDRITVFHKKNSGTQPKCMAQWHHSLGWYHTGCHMEVHKSNCNRCTAERCSPDDPGVDVELANDKAIHEEDAQQQQHAGSICHHNLAGGSGHHSIDADTNLMGQE